jgi:SAM-dependent methyltransferase
MAIKSRLVSTGGSMLAWAKGLLGHVSIYVALQRGLGADRLRYRCLDELALKEGECVLDVGCGPAYYFERMPDVRYFGFDTSQSYIDHAQKRFGSDRAEFHCEIFGEERVAKMPPVDAVMMLGLLHHLSDEESAQLLALAARALTPGGRVISVDTCYEATQGRISRWISDNDRGEYVREPEGFVNLGRSSFGQVTGEVLSGVTRIPGSFWMMRMSAPLVSSQARTVG